MDESKLIARYAPFAFTGEVNLTKPTHIFPTFIPHDINRPVARENFSKKGRVRKSKCTSKTPKIRFKTRKEDSFML
jgi:hypothetical protein